MKANGLRHGLLDGPCNKDLEGKFRVYKNKKSIDNHQIINAFYQSG